MSDVINRPRNGCALHGAVSTIEEIKGVVPIVHANAGCSVQNYLAKRAGGAGKGYIDGFSVPGTAAQERHVIFGGASRLREQIKNTIKVIEGGLYVVLNSCESAMVGDDIDAMTKEALEQGEPVLDSTLAGFHGDFHLGYAAVLSDIFQKLPETIRHIKLDESEKTAKIRVNILGILPQQDLFFKGELAEISRILAGIGVQANTFFEAENGVEELSQAASAALTIVFSQWGKAPAEKLKELHQIPYLEFLSIPTGIEEVTNFVKTIAKALDLAEDVCRTFLEKEAQDFYYYLRQLSDDYYEERYNRCIAVVGDERNVVQIGSFLKKYLGAVIESVVITDFFPNEELSLEEKKRQLADLSEEIYFSQDTNEIQILLRNSKAEVILGSSFEEETAQQKQAAYVGISFPLYHKVILNKSYAGIHGAITLAEDYCTKIKELKYFS